MKSLSTISILILIYFIISCTGNNEQSKLESNDVAISNLSGSELAKIHCGSCHGFVNPDLLSKSNWKNDVLPDMGYRMGIFPGGHQPRSLFVRDSVIIREANIYPDMPILNLVDWNKIVEYYLENSPDTILPLMRIKEIKIGLTNFKYREPSFSHRPPFTAMVKILPENKGIVYSDLKPRRNNLTFLDSDLNKSFEVSLKGAAINYFEKSDAIYLTTIGKNIFPHDVADGEILEMPKNESGKLVNKPSVVIPNLQRPVSVVYGDLNNDGLEDVVVCEFGNHTGNLVLYEKIEEDKYSKKVLREKAGAISAVIEDMNKDGFNDVIALMAQGDEGVFLYENKGDGTFVEKRLLSFLPLYGSQYIELADFNNDGFEDLLYVCGDNADKTPHLKKYHGIYIFLNDGNSNFNQFYFYHLNGAYKAMPRDFDLDGDLDIAAISYFPDYINYPEESFIYLENNGKLEFTDFSFPQSTNGRWIVMDAEDMDGDGDIDIVLGSFVYFIAKGDNTGISEKWLSQGPSIIVLENTIR